MVFKKAFVFIGFITLCFICISVISSDLALIGSSPHKALPSSTIPQTNLEPVYKDIQLLKDTLDDALKDASKNITHRDIDDWIEQYDHLLHSLKHAQADIKKTSAWKKATKDLGYCKDQLTIIQKQKFGKSTHFIHS